MKNFSLGCIIGSFIGDSAGSLLEFVESHPPEEHLIEVLRKPYNNQSNITGFLKSRLTYIFVGLFSIKGLFDILKKEKPDYLIVHLLTLHYRNMDSWIGRTAHI